MGDRAADVDRSAPRTRAEARRRLKDQLASMPAARRRLWPWWVGGALGLVFVGVAMGSVLLNQAVAVRSDLLAARATLTSLREEVSGGDSGAIAEKASAALDLTQRAEEIVQGPLWGVASIVPIVGENIAAVRSATTATNLLVADALPIAVQMLEIVDPSSITLSGGGLDLEPLTRASQLLPDLAGVLSEAKTQVDTIDTDAVVPVVRDALQELVVLIDDAEPAVSTASKYFPMLLDLLGKNGEKTYLIVFQNNAESRATGGNPSATAVMTVNNGALALDSSSRVAEFTYVGRNGAYLYDFPPETASLYEDNTTGYSQNYTRTPDFPTTVEMFQSLWTDVTGERFDGVISIDPVVLGYMLSVTGPVALPDGESITADNAARLLLSDTYERFGLDADATDLFFASVTESVFGALSGGGWDPVSMFSMLSAMADQQRIKLWFDDELAEQLIKDAGIDGALTTSNDEVTQIGLYLNDSAHSKLEYHLSQSIVVSCSPEERTVTTSVTLANLLPDSIVSAYTLGWRNASLGISRRSMMLDVLFFAPPDAAVLSADPSVGDIPQWDRSGVEKGHEAKSISVVIPPGETRTLSFTARLGGEGEAAPLELRYTPTVQDTPVTVDASCDGLFSE